MEELNLDAITIEDAELLYWEGKRVLINDGRVTGIVKETEQ